MFKYTAEKRNIYRLTLAGLIYGLLRDLNIVINRFGRHKGLFNSILGADIAVRSSIFKFSALSVILSIYALIVLLANKKFFSGDCNGYMSKIAFYSVLFPLGIPEYFSARKFYLHNLLKNRLPLLDRQTKIRSPKKAADLFLF